MDPLSLLASRRSIPSRLLGPPGPDDSQLRRILQVAVRVPDHGKLAPWRFIVVRGEHRARLGEWLAARGRQLSPQCSAAALEKDRQRFNHAPVVVIVVACLHAGHKVPEREQLLSGGAVCLQLLQAADAIGFRGQWLTGWAAYDADIARRLGLADNESILGFMHLGSSAEAPEERERPDVGNLCSELRL